jgi:hypothetical protein
MGSRFFAHMVKWFLHFAGAFLKFMAYNLGILLLEAGGKKELLKKTVWKRPKNHGGSISSMTDAEIIEALKQNKGVWSKNGKLVGIETEQMP